VSSVSTAVLHIAELHALAKLNPTAMSCHYIFIIQIDKHLHYSYVLDLQVMEVRFFYFII
jgi:hypothetical protein